MDSSKVDATNYLVQYWTGKGDALEFPVDPTLIAELVGLKFQTAKLKGDYVGHLMKDDYYALPRLVVDSNQKKDVQLFTCAHLIGKFASVKSAAPAEGFTAKMTDLSPIASSDTNKYANSFASNLMLPDAHLLSWLDEGKSAKWIAHYTKLPKNIVDAKISAVLSR